MWHEGRRDKRVGYEKGWYDDTLLVLCCSARTTCNKKRLDEGFVVSCNLAQNVHLEPSSEGWKVERESGVTE